MQSSRPIRLAIIGSHGTGKTTLATALSKVINVPYINGDIVREIVLKLGRQGVEELTDSEYWLMEFIHYTRQSNEVCIHQNFVSDGGFILDPVYLGVTRKLEEHDPVYSAFMSQCVLQTLEWYTHIVYLSPEIPLKEDGFRPQDTEFREKIDSFLIQTLKKYRIPFSQVGGSVDQRVRLTTQLLFEH